MSGESAAQFLSACAPRIAEFQTQFPEIKREEIMKPVVDMYVALLMDSYIAADSEAYFATERPARLDAVLRGLLPIIDKRRLAQALFDYTYRDETKRATFGQVDKLMRTVHKDLTIFQRTKVDNKFRNDGHKTLFELARTLRKVEAIKAHVQQTLVAATWP